MAIRNIVKEGDPILNKVCRPVTNFDDRLATLLDDMHETMIAADGVGLAGPQVGMLRRLFVVWDTTDAPEEIPEDYEYKFIDFVNPEILAVSEDEETAYEGCLSFPGHNGAVTRPAAVKVRAQDRNGNWFELEAEGLLARCIQHENDHLDGITIMQSSEYFYEDGPQAGAHGSSGQRGCAGAWHARLPAPHPAGRRRGRQHSGAGPGAHRGGGLWLHPARQRAEHPEIRLRQPACLPAAQVPWQRPGAVGSPQWGYRDGCLHHADG